MWSRASRSLTPMFLEGRATFSREWQTHQYKHYTLICATDVYFLKMVWIVPRRSGHQSLCNPKMKIPLPAQNEDVSSLLKPRHVFKQTFLLCIVGVWILLYRGPKEKWKVRRKVKSKAKVSKESPSEKGYLARLVCFFGYSIMSMCWSF